MLDHLRRWFMNLSEIENKVGAQLESIESAVPEPIGRFVAAPVEALKKLVPEKNAVIGPGLAITAATLGAVALGGWLRERSGLAGFDALGSGVPGFRQHRLFGRRANAGRIAAAIGMVAGGSFVLAAIQAMLGNRIMKNPAVRGAATAITALALERLVFRGRHYRAIHEALGWNGNVLKYAAIGTAYALASPRHEQKLDPTGGDISAGVPAM
jgi:hypothetical protein